MKETGRTRLKIWLVLVVVFVLGGVTGSALTGLLRSRASGDRRSDRAGSREQRFEKMRQDLNLDDKQTAAVRVILDETRNEYRALRTELRPRFEEPRLKARARIRALLNADQQQKFDVMAAQQDAEHNQEEKSRH
jgi:predicted metalloprotease